MNTIYHEIYFDPSNFDWGNIQMKIMEQTRDVIGTAGFDACINIEDSVEAARLHTVVEQFIDNYNPGNILTKDTDEYTR